MRDPVQITSREVFDQPQLLMLPPMSNTGSAIKPLLIHEGLASQAAVGVRAPVQHYDFAQVLERCRAGVNECSGCT